ncbi:MAG TPA: sulfatase-like hydrolase/transferase [Caldilineaceae bacterium]|nr:sulfatase-like hydrolase/transferase [Caldilineaceae bacterium]
MAKPNILFLMTDQMQGRVLDPDHPCQTPNFDRLASRGVRFTRAYTPNAVCSPARASLMTGLLPHNHGVLYVTHTVDDDQAALRTEHLHWAQQLVANGYRTGYFGKWHVERSGRLEEFGWQVNGAEGSTLLRESEAARQAERADAAFALERILDQPGYRPMRFYGVTNVPPEARGLGVRTQLALDFLDEVMDEDEPWCCFVSVLEPHDPFICGEKAFAQYDVASLPLPPNVHDDLSDRPNLYRRAAQIWHDWTDQERREAMACYYAMITEIDTQFGRLLDRLEEAAQLENTIVVLTSDHGELLGAHGLYCKNICAAEEVYNIPLVMAGPGIANGAVTDARVGLHDLCPTLLALTESPPIATTDAQSFTAVLENPRATASFQQGFAEYFGGRLILTQRVVWDGDWKLVFNGFDFDELYHLGEDPGELHNLAGVAEYQPVVERMTQAMWHKVEVSGDHSLFNSHYPILRIGAVGPLPRGE